jgi:UDP-N-acetylmuramoyl-L-alanyl-D-glutamate--2,6-diaminopimelate ligase
VTRGDRGARRQGEIPQVTKRLDSLIDGLKVDESRGDLHLPVSGIAYDSRRVEAGDVFVALPGGHVDGVDFIPDAIQRGARVIIAERMPNNSSQVTCLRVPDSRKALARLALNFYENPSTRFQLIGVTGTNGKTTTTFLLEGILKKAGGLIGVVGTLGYRWAHKQKVAPMTTPESSDLQRFFSEMNEDRVTHVVMEVSSHALSLGRVEGCVFDVGLFTNLSQDHLDFHVTMQDYFFAKTLLFRDDVSTRADGFMSVINTDDPYGKRLSEEVKGNLWSFSANDRTARVWVKSAELEHSGIQATLSTPCGDLTIRSPLLGRLNLYNLTAAAAAALAMGVSREAISEGLHDVSQVDGRLQRVPVPGVCGFEVVVDYAHTPDAMEKALSCLKEMTGGRLLVVFGCGGDRDRAKRPLMGQVAARFGDLVILTSDNPRSEVPAAIVREIEPGVQAFGFTYHRESDQMPDGKVYTVQVDRKQAIELALSWAMPGDVIFIGGKGHETYQIIGSKVFPFDDRVVVQDYLHASKRPL